MVVENNPDKDQIEIKQGKNHASYMESETLSNIFRILYKASPFNNLKDDN